MNNGFLLVICHIVEHIFGHQSHSSQPRSDGYQMIIEIIAFRFSNAICKPHPIRIILWELSTDALDRNGIRIRYPEASLRQQNGH